jgi:pentapeptide MXKDX repeat protein
LEKHTSLTASHNKFHDVGPSSYVDKMSLNEMSLDEMSSDEMSSDEMSLDEMSLEKCL